MKNWSRFVEEHEKEEKNNKKDLAYLKYTFMI